MITKNSRRDFIRYTSLATTSLLIPDFVKAVSSGEKILVLIHLSGGNDGLNTVVPYRNDWYYKCRPTLALQKNEIIRLDSETALNKNFSGFVSLCENGEAAILNGVGYPEQSGSHFDNLNRWHTADCENKNCSTGWIGRLLDREQSFQAVDLNYSLSKLLKGAKRRGVTHPELNSSDFSVQMKEIATSIISDSGFQIYHVTLHGFDTHFNQKPIQNFLLKTLGDSLKRFAADLKSAGKWEDTLVMTYSEFGRSPEENRFGGTEHGKSNTVFLAGGKLKQTGMLNELSLGDYTVDFRDLYASVLTNWFGINSPLVPGNHIRVNPFV